MSAARRPLAVVTGASSGIGEAYARGLAAEGMDLVLVARRGDRLEALAAELGPRHGANALVLAHDLGLPGAGARLAGALDDRGLAPDLLVNNAGVATYAPVAESDPAALDAMIAVNVAGLTGVTRAVYAGMAARRRGGIIHVASLAGFQAIPGMAVYAATKAYVLSFSEALSEEARPHGVKVLAVCPGNTESEIHGKSGVDEAAVRRAPMMPAEQVVAESLRALRAGHAVHVPGPLNAFGAGLSRFLPREVATRLAGQIMKLGATGSF